MIQSINMIYIYMYIYKYMYITVCDFKPHPSDQVELDKMFSIPFRIDVKPASGSHKSTWGIISAIWEFQVNASNKNSGPQSWEISWGLLTWNLCRAYEIDDSYLSGPRGTPGLRGTLQTLEVCEVYWILVKKSKCICVNVRFFLKVFEH